MNKTAIQIIGKYALVLSVFYILEYLAIYFIGRELDETKPNIYSYLMFAKATVPFLLNIIAAIILSLDKNKLEIQGKYSVLLTVFYRPIGIVLFLIYVIEKEIKKASTQHLSI